MKVKFITDSSADLPKEVVKDLDITVLPIELSFGSEIFLDNVTITNEEFYEKLRKCRELPKTSQINQFVFEDAFRPYKGTDTLVVAIIISSEMSATIEAARRAQQELAMDNLLVVDSQLVTFALGAYVVEAAKLAKEAQSKEELLEKLEALRSRVKLYAYVDDLKYLRYGGRLSAASMHIANFLRLHPVITIDKKVEVVSKQIGVAKCLRYMIEKVREEADLSYPLYFGNSDCPEKATDFEERLLSEVKGSKAYKTMAQLGPTVGTHAGPGCIGVVFIAKN